jgi:two-component system OmpR family sensor kinase
MSLRTRLLISLVFLVAAALVVAAGAIYADQSSYLNGRADQATEAAAAPISYALGLDARQLSLPPKERRGAEEGHPSSVPAGRDLAGFVPPGSFGEFVSPTGVVLRGPLSVSAGRATPPRPAIPFRLLRAQSSGGPKLYTVLSKPKSRMRFRLAVIPLETGAGALVVATPLGEVDATLDRLIVVEAIVVAGVLIALVGVAWAVIRLALRPLDEMSRVANEITEGDLSRRVTPATPRTEIGRLGLSLNRMLGHIEDAFIARARSEERQRRFLADVSHELRTPLASIRGYAELFRLGPARDAAALERAMARIEADAARMGVLVDGLLALARLDRLPDSQRGLVDLGEIASQAVADARAVNPSRPIALTADRPVEVYGDTDGLRRVLSNLVGNALTHTPGDAPVEVRVQREGADAVVEVSDRGPGLPAGAEEQVFERFWRADGRHGHAAAGSGLGLAIVQEIVAAHDGTVRAANRGGGGAVFTVRLPAAEPPRPAAEPVEPNLSAAARSAG